MELNKEEEQDGEGLGGLEISGPIDTSIASEPLPESPEGPDLPAAAADVSSQEEMTPVGNGQAPSKNPYHDLPDAEKIPSVHPTISANPEVKETLPDGSAVFQDGTIVHTDGTVVRKHAGHLFIYPVGQIKPIVKQDPEAQADNPQIQDIADSIINGEQPPSLQGMYKNGMALKAALAKKHYPLAQAQLDFEATKRHLATMNGQKQTSLMQSADNAFHGLEVVDELAKEWDGGKYPLLNRASLASAKAGTGDFAHLDEKSRLEAQRIATLLDAQIANLSTELANVNMGGGTPTDHAMQLAAKELSSDWSKDVLLHATDLARRNIRIRLNSMKSVGVIGASANNSYAPKSDDSTEPSPTPSATPSATPNATPSVAPIRAPNKAGVMKTWKLKDGGDPKNPADYQVID